MSAEDPFQLLAAPLEILALDGRVGGDRRVRRVHDLLATIVTAAGRVLHHPVLLWLIVCGHPYRVPGAQLPMHAIRPCREIAARAYNPAESRTTQTSPTTSAGWFPAWFRTGALERCSRSPT